MPTPKLAKKKMFVLTNPKTSWRCLVVALKMLSSVIIHYNMCMVLNIYISKQINNNKVHVFLIK